MAWFTPATREDSGDDNSFAPADIDAPQNLETGPLEAWFLGPKAENAGLLEQLIVDALRDHVYWRRNFHPGDPTHITEEKKREIGFLEAHDRLKEEFAQLLATLKKSVPFFSMRYQGHMNWDVTLPGVVGYFAAMLYNPNNVAFEGSTVTTALEQLAAEDICRMLGYRFDDPIKPWGHLTCDGTVANIEALWSARNAKFYPCAIHAAVKAMKSAHAAKARKLEVTLGNGMPKALGELDTWELLNLPCDVILDLPERIAKECRLGIPDLMRAAKPFTVQELGWHEFAKSCLPLDIQAPVVLVSGTKHYSMPKAMALLGLGTRQLINIPIDRDARMDREALKGELSRCLADRIPVIAVVAVIGSTEESAVDPLADVIEIRNEFRQRGLDFNIHADAAWGGYHASTIRTDAEVNPDLAAEQFQTMRFRGAGPAPRCFKPSAYVQAQLTALREADSITVDPHKSGYIPYPAGALCYRNEHMRDLVSISAPYIVHGDEPTMGIYGVEGSKPGAAAAAVFLSHSVIRPSESGYGAIIGAAMFNCKRLYCRLMTMDDEISVCVPVPRLPEERQDVPNPKRVAVEKGRIKEIDQESNAAIQSRGWMLDFLMDLGPDQNILTYAFNFKINGKRNASLAKLNEFNKRLYEHLSIKPNKDIYDRTLIVSTTDFTEETYGKEFIRSYKERLGVGRSRGTTITVLRSVVMDPWLTETYYADRQSPSFLDVIEAEFRKAISEILKQPYFHGREPRSRSEYAK